MQTRFLGTNPIPAFPRPNSTTRDWEYYACVGREKAGKGWACWNVAYSSQSRLDLSLSILSSSLLLFFIITIIIDFHNHHWLSSSLSPLAILPRCIYRSFIPALYLQGTTNQRTLYSCNSYSNTPSDCEWNCQGDRANRIRYWKGNATSVWLWSWKINSLLLLLSDQTSTNFSSNETKQRI